MCRIGKLDFLSDIIVELQEIYDGMLTSSTAADLEHRKVKSK